MTAISFIDRFPLWALYLITTAIVLLSTEAGWRLGNYRQKSHREEKKAPVSTATGSTLALLAFLLTFTFGMAATRFDTRKQIVLQEANAIGTTYLRTDFLPESSRQEARNLLREYTALRAGGEANFLSPEGMSRASVIQDQLWTIAANAQTSTDTVATGLFIQSLNEMIDLDATRVTASRNRIPDSIWLVLCAITILSMTAMGYQFGLTGARSWATMIFLVMVFTPVILLIADLDRPQVGVVQVSQQALLDLLNKIGTPVP
jgi:amino acid permease